MSATTATLGSRTRSLPARWAPAAWGAIATTAAFIALTAWWLTRDHSVPIYDAGLRLHEAFAYRDLLAAGDLLGPFAAANPHPPLVMLVGAVATFAGGVSISAPILASNLIFVTLLALGCYHVGRLAAGPAAGLLAVVFALGSPLLIAQFHVFMIDGPLTAMVAVSIWLILATRRFSRIKASALAGLAVGLGLLVKEPLAFFVAGPIVVTLLRGGWRNWRGITTFAAVALVIAGPWYINSLTTLQTVVTGVATTGQGGAGDIFPGRFSLSNLEWYLWNVVNAQLFLPLLLFALVGTVTSIAHYAKRRTADELTPELLGGLFVSWLGITLTYPHDTRYSMPLLVYLAVLGSSWIVRLRTRPARLLATCALAAVALGNTLAVSFGIGGELSTKVAGQPSSSLARAGQITLYSNAGFLVAGPRRDGDLLAMLRGLRRNGVRRVLWSASQAQGPDFSVAGLVVLARVARLIYPTHPVGFSTLGPRDAFLLHMPIDPAGGSAPPCIRLDNGSGIWVRLGNPNAPHALDFCPSRQPAFYGP
jgi:4-amino-4-deoxy-L-arabinose transferase-like glycosyltransferase